MNEHGYAPPSTTLLDELLKAWTARAESLLRQCQPAPGCMAFLLDRLADAVLAGVPVLQDQAPAGANAEGAAAAAGGRQQRAAPGGEASAPLPRPLAQWLSDRVQVRRRPCQRHQPPKGAAGVPGDCLKAPVPALGGKEPATYHP